MAEQPETKRLKRSCATPQAHSWPLVPGMLVLEICRWLGGHQLAAKEGRRRFLQAEAMGSVVCVDRFWRRCCEAACWELFSQEFQQVLRTPGIGFSPLRAAQQLEAWWEEQASTELDAPLVAGLVAESRLGAAWASRFRFRRASKIVKWKELPRYSDADFDRKMDEYSADDGPVMQKGTKINGYGKVTHIVSAALSNQKEVLEIRAEMFYEVDEGNVSDDSQVWVTMRPAGRVTQKTPGKVLLEMRQRLETDEEDGYFNQDVAKSVASFFGRETIEDSMQDLRILLQSIFNGVEGPCSYAPMWSRQLCSLIKQRNGAHDDLSSDDDEDLSSDE
ncbi:unnamed protein product [Effrenium voratum]|uniref:Uncharacterized protein n=1 Tax=Effrenium voratum TaxID=2562239 RepID=A0AA36N143_9DINO|nr:unnamed protein product [Effrenium voratum]CAJ1429236.1 unnamed protein product [Effrenium voratum]